MHTRFFKTASMDKMLADHQVSPGLNNNVTLESSGDMFEFKVSFLVKYCILKRKKGGERWEGGIVANLG